MVSLKRRIFKNNSKTTHTNSSEALTESESSKSITVSEERTSSDIISNDAPTLSQKDDLERDDCSTNNSHEKEEEERFMSLSSFSTFCNDAFFKEEEIKEKQRQTRIPIRSEQSSLGTSNTYDTTITNSMNAPTNRSCSASTTYCSSRRSNVGDLSTTYYDNMTLATLSSNTNWSTTSSCSNTTSKRNRIKRKSSNKICLVDKEDYNAAIVYDTLGGVDVLKLDFYGDLVPCLMKEENVIVKISASTVSRTDSMIRRGASYLKPPSLPTTPGLDCIGTILKVGAEVKHEGQFEIGDKVCSLLQQQGGNSNYITLSSSSLISVPHGVDDAEAVSMIHAFMTAYQSLHRVGLLPRSKDKIEGKHILVIDAVSPIGQATIQLARRAKAGKIYATTSKEYRTFFKSVQVETLDLDPSTWLPSLQGTIDIVIDGYGDCIDSSHKALKDCGRLICVGVDSSIDKDPGYFGGLPLFTSWNVTRAKYLMSHTFWYNVYDSFQAKPDIFKHDLEYLFSLLQKKKIKPFISEYIPLSLVPNAHDRIEKRETIGIIVCFPAKVIEEDNEYTGSFIIHEEEGDENSSARL